MNTRRIIIVLVGVIILIAIGLALSSFFKSKKPEKQSPRISSKLLSVRTNTVEYQQIKTIISGQGRLSSNAVINLSSEVQGKIIKGNVPLKKGQSFRKGNVLFRVDATETALNLKATKSRFLNSLANILPDIKVDYPSRFQVWNDFFNSISIDKPLPRLPETTTSQEKIFLASRNILSEYYSIKRDESRLAKYTIRAPFSGSFTDVSAEVGAIASPGMRIGSIINTTNLELEIAVNQKDATFLEIGQSVEVMSPDREMKWKAKLLRKSNYVDAGTQSVLVYVFVQPNKNAPLYQGQYLYAEFGGITLKNAFEIPRKAIMSGDYIYSIDKDSLLVKTKVNVLKTSLETSYVDGPEVGQRVVVEPLINVQEGSKVTFN